MSLFGKRGETVSLLERVRTKIEKLARENRLLHEDIQVASARPLSPQEALGQPDRRDFPLLKGKEVMIKATFRGACWSGLYRPAGSIFWEPPGRA
ncbi:MAG: hypothetical protein ACPLRW_09895 [Moorellales bacterium]